MDEIQPGQMKFVFEVNKHITYLWEYRASLLMCQGSWSQRLWVSPEFS